LDTQIRKFIERFPIPAPRTAYLLGLGIAAALIAGWPGAIVVDLCVLILIVADCLGAIRGGAGVLAERHCPERFSQGISQDIEIVLKNPRGRAIRFQIRDETPLGWDAAPILKGVIPPQSSLRRHYTVMPPVRGAYSFGDLFLRTLGPLGMLMMPIRLHAPQKIEVYPSLQPLRYSDLATYRRRALHWGARPGKWRGEGREFEALREYVQGDDPRKIHWKATARLDRPIVQEFLPEKNQIVMVLMDAGRLMGAISEGKTKLDHAIEAAAQLIHTALSRGDQVGLLAFADQVLAFVPPKKGMGQVQAILKGILDLRAKAVEPQYERAFLWLRSQVRRRCLVVLWTDLLDEVISENLLSALALLRPRHLPLCVAIRESEWDDLLALPPSRVHGVYERVVLQEMLRQRSKALKTLVQKGALAMDLPPAGLSAGVLERYMEVKRKGLL